jgi:hypothetical protein
MSSANGEPLTVDEDIEVYAHIENLDGDDTLSVSVNFNGTIYEIVSAGPSGTDTNTMQFTGGGEVEVWYERSSNINNQAIVDIEVRTNPVRTISVDNITQS